MRQSPFATLLAAAIITLCPVPGHAQQPPPAPAADPAVAEAQAHFVEGQKAYADKRYEDALAEFRASYKAVPSPNSHLYIARCLRGMERLPAAYDEYTQVILESADRAFGEKKYEGTLKAASEERAALKDRVATLVLAVPADAAGAKVWVGADEVPAARWNGEVTVTPGATKVRAEAPGRIPFEVSITLAPGSRESLAVVLPIAPPPPPVPIAPPPPPIPVEAPNGVLRPVAYVAAGVGVVGFVVGGVLWAEAESRYQSLQQMCDGRCPASDQSSVNTGRAETAGAQAAFVIGAVGVAAGVTLWTVDFVQRRDAPRVGSLRLEVAPARFTVGGSF